LATHKSALKRHRQSVKKNLVNTAHRTRIRTLVTRVTDAIGAHDKDAALNALIVAIPALQKAAARGIIHRNTASRNISRLTVKVNAVAAAPPIEPARKPAKAKKPGRKSAAK